MKPTKSRVMCPDCGKQKMLFETEKKAQNFLKFNGDAVNPDGTREMRVYYCPACCGYHISSHQYKGKGKRTDRLIEGYRKETGGSILETLEVFKEIVAKDFNNRKELNRWLSEQTQWTEKSKERAKTKYYAEIKSLKHGKR